MGGSAIVRTGGEKSSWKLGDNSRYPQYLPIYAVYHKSITFLFLSLHRDPVG